MKQKKDVGQKIICLNRKASFNYFFKELLEAGLSLKGSEIKSIREGRASIADSYAVEKNGVSQHIPSGMKLIRSTTHCTAQSRNPRYHGVSTVHANWSTLMPDGHEAHSDNSPGVGKGVLASPLPQLRMHLYAVTPMAPHNGGTSQKTVANNGSIPKHSSLMYAATIEPVTTNANRTNALAFHQNPKPSRIRFRMRMMPLVAALGLVSNTKMAPILDGCMRLFLF